MPSLIVVDDDPDIASILATLLCTYGHEAKTAANGQEAMDLIERDGPPGLILLDLRMPVMSGSEFIEASRIAIPETPIIILSAEYDPRSLVPLDQRITRFLPKPCSLTDILGAVELGLKGMNSSALGA